ncbi:hypothetical protein AAMO2058_000973100 [Amorphochlora amoebiformis]
MRLSATRILVGSVSLMLLIAGLKRAISIKEYLKRPLSTAVKRCRPAAARGVPWRGVFAAGLAVNCVILRQRGGGGHGLAGGGRGGRGRENQRTISDHCTVKASGDHSVIAPEDIDTVGKIESTIVTAIKRGSEVYNYGDAKGCCQEYIDAMQKVQQLCAENPKFYTVQYTIDKMNMAIRSDDDPNFTDMAWALRRTLEFINSHVKGLKEVYTSTDTERLLFDFSDPTMPSKWYPVNDGVMGGASTSDLRFNSNSKQCTFTGTLSSVNNGGFASLRGAVKERSLTGLTDIEIEAKGDGRIYKLNVIGGPGADMGLVYQKDFKPPKDEFSTTRLSLTDFKPSVMGRSYPDAPPIDSKEIRQIGLMISKVSDSGGATPEFEYGDFRLELKAIRAIKADP